MFKLKTKKIRSNQIKPYFENATLVQCKIQEVNYHMQILATNEYKLIHSYTYKKIKNP
jgi:hypothetical protein